MTKPTEQSRWVERAQAGDADAFGALVRRYQNAAYAIALSHLRRPTDAEDVVQEAFVAAWCRLSQLRDVASFGGWLRRIVTAQSLQWLRHGRAQGSGTTLDTASQSLVAQSEDQEGRLWRQQLWSEVERLPEQHRTATLLYYLSAFSYEEIASFLEVPVTTVKGRLQQARIRLKETLSGEDWKEIEMGQTDVSDEVLELVYQIATQRIDETISMGHCRNAVVFLGVTAAVEVCQAEGDDLVIQGTRASMGRSAEEALRSAQTIQVQADRVADFAVAGPHPGEVFRGTSSDDGKPIAQASPSADDWTIYRDRIGERAWNLRSSDGFPEFHDLFNPVHEDLWPALRDVVRVSIQREKMEALTLPRGLHTERLTSVLATNYSDDKWVQGPVGRADVTVHLPAGRTLILINAEDVAVRRVDGHLFVVNGRGCDVECLRGALYLLNTPLERAADLQGTLFQRYHSYGGASAAGERFRRHTAFHTTLEDVGGDMDIDVGRVQIEARRLSGRVHLRNRYGDTTMRIDKELGDSRICVDSTSGTVAIELPAALRDQIPLTALTACGTIDYADLRGALSRRTANTRQLTLVSTVQGTGPDFLSAALLARTECGEITIRTR